ncbi:MAG: metallophosphoesterase [candidate division KSB1 bacterium]|nr:metallophosphoesterase [candidate division KSB1 bacterium]MDZ7368487.1 metallophosphoesterase [candidate division KSB1 bacterium]MDZ7406213.1 metallophosphoesterase [candidate division KSB1 bacterium]
MFKSLSRFACSSCLLFFVGMPPHDSQAQSNAAILVAKNSIWKYEASGTDLGTSWRQASFNDSAWPSGNGIFGFGESYISTALPPGRMTYYFRQAFTLTNDPATFTQLTLLANYDDGFVAYLNGSEVARRSMPAGPISYATSATSHEGGFYEIIDLTAHLNKLVAGTNVIAVEVHQITSSSSDLVMDMELKSYGTTPLVAQNAVWKYHASGSDLGTAWQQVSFNDSSWPSGNGIFGFGENYLTTPLPAGNLTYYFRHAFTLAVNPATFSSLTLLANYDDGFVAYLNGSEVARRSMPAGPIAYSTSANSHEGGVYEIIDVTAHLNKLVIGTNVLAVEVHQLNAASSDLVMDMELNTQSNAGEAVSVVRAPYLQIGTPTSIVVRWRTNIPANSRVRYGTNLSNLSLSAQNSSLTTEHVVQLSNLSPNTKYYYSIGTTTQTLAGGSDFYFITSPPAGVVKKTRVWVLGDAGYGNAAQQRVRDAYHNFTGATHTDLFVLLGDNAYDNGTDAEYQAAVFDMHPATLRKSVLWPTFGNHDAASASSPTQSGVFYDIFSLPANGEAGGVPSGTEAYYSFNYANIHFICLNSHDISRAPNGAMLTWLQQDLAANTLPWTIALWHHPPYSKGSHDSDAELNEIEMRQNALPILENSGVDLVLSGHSHSYERSFLLDGHYGQSISLITNNILDGGSGRIDGSGAYTKATYGSASHQGAVYIVAGSSSYTSGGPLNHPAMYQSLDVLGSVVLDIDSNRVDVKFLDDLGGVRDYFTMLKGVQNTAPPAAPNNLVATAAGSEKINLTWNDQANNESGFKIERKTSEGAYAEIATVGANVTSYTNTGLTSGTTYFYRVRAHNNIGNSAYSNQASAATLTSSTVTLIAKNAVWKYEASGSDLGATWQQINSHDANWSSGNGALGFGESYIYTPLPSGKSTYYFRKTFTLSGDPSMFSQLNLLANYDDGFVAYLNGFEVARQAMPSGPVNYSTLAFSHEGGAYETIDLTAHLNKLVIGTNVLAVEVHQHHIESSDLVMDMELQASTLSTLIPKNSVWKYEASGANLGTAWQQASFNDGSWPSGNGILGFGETYITTSLPAGNSTYYFRKTFTLSNDPTTFLQLNLLANYDDGFVAYLNGSEVARRSMPAGPISYSTLAFSHEGGAYETIDLSAYMNKLVIGTNVLAIEIHQHHVSSSDLVMDMALLAQSASAPGQSAPTKDHQAEKESAVIPDRFQLYQNHPNPFNPSTVIRFGLPEDATVSLKVFNLIGEEVTTLVEGSYPAGTHSVTFLPKNLANGIYFYVMQAGQTRLIRKCSFMK